MLHVTSYMLYFFMLKLFSGSANLHLSKEVAKLLNTPLAEAEIVRFGNSEVKVTVQEDVQDDYCVIIQATSNPTDTHIMEMALFCDALRRQEAQKVMGIIPYFGYAKQDIQHRPGECVSVNVVIKLFETIGFNKLITLDLHDEGSAGIFTIPFKNASAFPLLAHKIADFFKNKKINLNKVALVSPDQGAVEKVRKFGIEFYGTEKFNEVVIEKKRDQNVMHKAEPYDLYGDIKGKIAIIVDDMVVSGSTMIPAINLCLARGATEVYAAAVHHDFTEGAAERLQNSKLIKFFTTNTIAFKPGDEFAKMIEYSVAPVIAEELQTLKNKDKLYPKQ